MARIITGCHPERRSAAKDPEILSAPVLSPSLRLRSGHASRLRACERLGERCGTGSLTRPRPRQRPLCRAADGLESPSHIKLRYSNEARISVAAVQDDTALGCAFRYTSINCQSLRCVYLCVVDSEARSEEHTSELQSPMYL